MGKIKITAIVGSLRKKSFNRQLALTVKDILADKADVEILDYSDIPFMNEDIEYPTPESVKRIRDIINASDGVWFFTPEYNHYFSGVLKNVVDWLSRKPGQTESHVLLKKPVAISGVSNGMTGSLRAQDHLALVLHIIGAKVMGGARTAVAHAWDKADENGKIDFSASITVLEKQAERFLRFISE